MGSRSTKNPQPRIPHTLAIRVYGPHQPRGLAASPAPPTLRKTRTQPHTHDQTTTNHQQCKNPPNPRHKPKYRHTRPWFRRDPVPGDLSALFRWRIPGCEGARLSSLHPAVGCCGLRRPVAGRFLRGYPPPLGQDCEAATGGWRRTVCRIVALDGSVRAPTGRIRNLKVRTRETSPKSDRAQDPGPARPTNLSDTAWVLLRNGTTWVLYLRGVDAPSRSSDRVGGGWTFWSWFFLACTRVTDCIARNGGG